MTTIDIDGMGEEEFRRSIESRLRQGLESKAVERLRALLRPFAGPDKILPERFLTVGAKDLALGGWDALGDSLKRHDRPGRPVTALSVAFGWPGEELPEPDSQGCLSPTIETGYYTDDAFPFSQSGREDLLEGYSYHGCTWTGDCEATDTALWLTGVDDLHGALALLEARLLASDVPDEDGIRAGSLGACLLSVLLHQAVGDRISQAGLPRPLCVMSGSNGVYPYFDAPVAGFPEDALKAAALAEESETAVDAGVPAPRYSSLLVTGIPRARKRAVLVLAETADEEAQRITRLRGLNHGESIAEPARPEPLPGEPAPSLPEAAIAPMPDSPLLAKKPSGQSWDFREMLSDYEPEPESGGAEPPGPNRDGDTAEPVAPEQGRGGDPPAPPDPDWDDDAPRGPPDDPLPALPAAGAAAPVGPGFSLLDALRLERAPIIFPLPGFGPVEDEAQLPAPSAAPAPESEPELELESKWERGPEPEPEPTAAEAAVPIWPSDPTWLRDVEARILPKPPQREPAAPHPLNAAPPRPAGLWVRLRNWWYGRS